MAKTSCSTNHRNWTVNQRYCPDCGQSAEADKFSGCGATIILLTIFWLLVAVFVKWWFF